MTFKINLSIKDQELVPFIVSEQSALSNILFTIFYASTSDAQDVRNLLTLIQKGSESFAADRKKLPDDELVKNQSYALLSSLTMSFVATIQLNGEGLQMDNVQFSKFSSDLNSLLSDDKKWGMPDFSSVIMFTWGMYVFTFEDNPKKEFITKSIDKVCFSPILFFIFAYFLERFQISGHYDSIICQF